MERTLDSYLESVMNTKGVTGVVCADANGLCLQARGTLHKDAAGVLSELTRLANKLEPTNNCKPVVCLEADSNNIIAHSEGTVTVAVQKAHSSS